MIAWEWGLGWTNRFTVLSKVGQLKRDEGFYSDRIASLYTCPTGAYDGCLLNARARVFSECVPA